MEKFANIDGLMEALRYEARETTRFPVRFILVQGLSAWKDILDRLRLEVEETLELSSFCRGQDAFPYLASLVEALKNNNKKKILVLPLAECLRFVPSSIPILRDLATLEKVGQRRVYIPLLEMDDIFTSEMEKIDRYRQGLLPAVWTLKGQGEVKVQVAPFRLKSKANKTVTGIKSYLQVWEKGGQDEIHLVSHLAPHFNSLMGNFEVRIYKNAFEFARENLSGLAYIRPEWGEDRQWQWLIEEMEEQEEFNELAASIFNVNRYDPWQLYSRWETLDANKKWLLWLWSKLEAPAGTYLHLALKDSNSASHLEEDIANSVFKHKLGANQLKERKTLLERLKVKEIPSSFWLAFDAIEDPLEKLKSLTGITVREKENAILAVKELIEKDKDREIWWPFLEIAYPELSYYLTPCQFEDQFLSTYFWHYVKSRVLDRPTAELTVMVREAAEAKKIWPFPTRGSLLEKMANDDTYTIWVDGMGLEWSGLIWELINRQENIKIEIHVARTYLPTTTELNRGWKKEEEVERGLDDIAHKYNYHFPRSLVEELGVIKNVAERAIELLKQHKEVIITSDHGLTRFAFYGGRSQVPEGAKVHKWGRYAELKEDNSDDTVYSSTVIVDNNKFIVAVHEKLEGGSSAIGEVHGGATFEECLVPIIRLSRALSTHLPEFKLAASVIKLNARGEGHLVVMVAEQIKSIWLKVAGLSFVGSQLGPGKWSIPIKNLKKGKYRGKLEYEDGTLGEIEFEITRGLIAEDLGL